MKKSSKKRSIISFKIQNKDFIINQLSEVSI
jgi:hypothetical protein